MRRIAAILALTALPFAALAAGGDGGDEEDSPQKTRTSTECQNGQVWDEKTRACTDAKSGAFDNDTLYRAVRELAWAGRPEDALVVLAAMTEGETDRVLTYRGFALRKADRLEEGLAAYAAALAANPDNLLARSYLGQAYVEMGETALAEAELAQIRARGGAGRWPEVSLSRALATGLTYAH
jgi:tetratricopeptide (TPR) repeat protein